MFSICRGIRGSGQGEYLLLYRIVSPQNWEIYTVCQTQCWAQKTQTEDALKFKRYHFKLLKKESNGLKIMANIYLIAHVKSSVGLLKPQINLAIL